MAWQTLHCSLLVIFMSIIGVSGGSHDDLLRYQCYDCTYFKGMAEMNPNCKTPELTAPIREDCEICSERVYKNATRVYIKRACTRHCEDGREYSVQYQDLQNVMVTEYCCKGDLCNVGNGSRANHQAAAPQLVLTTFFGLLLSALVYSH